MRSTTFFILIILSVAMSTAAAMDEVTAGMSSKCDKTCRAAMAIIERLNKKSNFSMATKYWSSDDNLGITTYTLNEIGDGGNEKEVLSIRGLLINGSEAVRSYPYVLKNKDGKVVSTLYRIEKGQDGVMFITSFPSDLPDGFIEKIISIAQTP
jgi:hypothetical protein